MANEGLIPSIEDDEKRRAVINKLQKVRSKSCIVLNILSFLGLIFFFLS